MLILHSNRAIFGTASGSPCYHIGLCPGIIMVVAVVTKGLVGSLQSTGAAMDVSVSVVKAKELL